jgi:hypothetical protein
MARFQEIISGLLCSLGVVLLMGSFVLVPTSATMGQDTGLQQNCPNSAGCNDGCITDACFQAGCTNVVGCTCTNNTYDPNCSARCKCVLLPAGAQGCECGNKYKTL